MRPLACLAACLVLAACAPGTGAGSPLASEGRSMTAASQIPPGETLTGQLGADSIEGGCPYLETDDGTRYEVLYPSGWEVDRGSGTLRDPDGAVVARPGDTITIRGSRAEGMASLCQIGPIFRATEVIVPQGAITSRR